MNRWNRRRLGRSFRGTDAVFIILFLLIGAFHVAAVRTTDSYGPDSSLYLGLAHNILQTGTYEFNFQNHTIFPPGFPALLALLSLTAGEQYAVLSRFMPVLSTLGTIIWYLLLRRTEGRASAGTVCLLVATSVALFREVTQTVLSEPAFYLFSALTLLLYPSSDGKRSGLAIRALLPAAVCVTMAATILIRSAAITLCAAFLLTAVAGIWRRTGGRPVRWRLAFAAGATGLAAYAGWAIWVKQVNDAIPDSRDRSSYAGKILLADPRQPELGPATAGQIFLRILTLTPVQVSHLAAMATRAPYVTPVWYSPLVCILFALLATGVLVSMVRGPVSVPVWYFTAYFGMFMIWPFDEGPRFMWPVAPLALALACRGWRHAVRAMRTQPATVLTAITGAAVAMAVLAATSERLAGAQAAAARVFWPLLAILGAGLLIGARRLGREASSALASAALRIPRRYRLAYWTAGVLAAGGLFQQAVETPANLSPDVSKFRHAASADLAAWLRTADDGPVMAQQYAIVHRLSGRKIIGFPLTSDPASLRDALLQSKARYMAVNDTLPNEYIRPTEEDRWARLHAAYPQLLELARRGPGYRVFTVRP